MKLQLKCCSMSQMCAVQSAGCSQSQQHPRGTAKTRTGSAAFLSPHTFIHLINKAVLYSIFSFCNYIILLKPRHAQTVFVVSCPSPCSVLYQESDPCFVCSFFCGSGACSKQGNNVWHIWTLIGWAPQKEHTPQRSVVYFWVCSETGAGRWVLLLQDHSTLSVSR